MKIVGQRETSRFVRTSKALTRVVARFGSVRSLPRTRQFLTAANTVKKLPNCGLLAAANGELHALRRRLQG
ncbi:hypothetical protein [Streptomyces sp. NPDC001714]|uniref:hypothetical protein n=1 Tax=Streptomyces sp. NPDC001714 TaxID=3364603 RepID=UPI0036C550CF